jgi:hypothetical protein
LGRENAQRFALFGLRQGSKALFFDELGGTCGTAGFLKLRQPLRTVLVYRILLKLLLVAARPGHHGLANDSARRIRHYDSLSPWSIATVNPLGFTISKPSVLLKRPFDILAAHLLPAALL